MAILTFKCVDGSDPRYLQNKLSRYVPARALRSTDQGLFTVTFCEDSVLGITQICSQCPGSLEISAIGDPKEQRVDVTFESAENLADLRPVSG